MPWTPLLTALALGPSAVGTAAPDPLPLVGGTVADTCQWPATVLTGGCSGTLVHPEIVLYAAHCGSAQSVRFGVGGDDRTVSVQYCADAPEYPVVGFDYAYCRLAEPVTDVPIAPILMGCERDQLVVDTPVVVVGFGQTNASGGGFGTKRWADATVAGFPSDGKLVGLFYPGPEIGACFGDSGGSTYVQLDDGTWRLVGITSTIAGTCGGSSQHVPAWAAAAFVEQDSGIDVTPCHDADGAWNPGPDCTALPLDIDDGSGLSWATGCGPGGQSPALSTCGPAVGEPPDATPPTIAIVTPAAGEHDGPLFQTPIELDVADDWGLLDVTLAFAEAEEVVFEGPPYAVPSVSFPEGTWELTARARDWSGNVADAVPVVIEVGPAGAATGTDGGDTAADDSSGGPVDPDGSTGGEPSEGSTGAAATGDPEGDSTGEVPPAAGGDDGCGCRTPESGSSFAVWWAVVLAVSRGSRWPRGCTRSARGCGWCARRRA